MTLTNRFTPFKVTFSLQTPVVLGAPWLNFDGVISHLIFRERLGQDYYTLPSKEPVTIHDGQLLKPLKRSRTYGAGDGGEIIHASVAQFDVSIDQAGTVTVYKRFDEQYCHEIATDTRKVNVGSGLFRAYMMKLPYLPARSATFYCNGDLAEIVRLIGYLPGLGKKTAYGYGMINSVSVEETPEDYSLIKDGVAMRPLPCSFGYDSDEKMMLAYKSPYWDKRNVAVCVPPGAKVYGY